MPTVTTKYFVQAGSAVMLDVTIGNGGAGWSAAFVGQALVAQGDPLSQVNLGDGGALAGKDLVVSSTAVDLQNTSHVVTQVLLSGGIPASQPIVQSAATPPHGSANFLTVVSFVAAGGAQ